MSIKRIAGFLGILTVIGITSISFNPQRALAIHASITNRYTFDTANLQWSQTAAEIRDSVGTVHGDAFNLTTSNMVAAGKINQALGFTNNGYVNLGQTIPVLPTQNYTVSLWARIPAAGANGTFISQGLSSPANRGLHLFSFNGKLQAIVGGVTNDPNYTFSGATWTHVALVNSNATGVWRNSVYINGALATTQSSGTYTPSGIDVLLGARRDTSNSTTGFFFANGTLDDVRVYNSALSATDIAAIYNQTDDTPPGNQSPTVSAGSNQTITLPTNSVTLTGSASDSDGTISSYAWTKVSGTGSTITSPAAASTTVTGLTQGSYVFRLTATDNAGASTSADVTVTVNAAPVGNVAPTVNAGNNQTITLPTSSVTLSGTASDSDGTISSYAWTKVSGTGSTITTPSAANTTVTGLSQGSYTFRLTVTDNGGATATDDVVVTVNAAPVGNVAPTVNAGVDQTITLPTSSVTLNGTASDSDGTISSYAWTKISGTGGTITSASTASTSITGLTQGTYVFRLTVLDDDSASAFDEVRVTVNPASGTRAPYGGTAWAIPGTIQAENYDIGGQNLAFFDSTSTNQGGQYRTDAVDIETTNDGGAGHTVGYVTAGEWLTYSIVADTSGGYTVQARAAAPTAGKSLRIEVDGITVATMTLPQTAGWQSYQTVTSPAFSLTEGAHIVRVYAVTNNFNLNWIKFESTAAPSNQPPTVSAGANQTITLPGNTVTLTGTASDPDGAIVSYAWTRLSGSGVITSASAASTSITSLTEGTSLFRLTVTDNAGAAAFSDVSVTVNQGSTGSCPAQTVVVLGSSTAYGSGATPIENSWANKFKAYLQSENASHQLVNLGIPSTTTYAALPTGTTGNPFPPDPDHNITKALTYSPDALIVNYPSNDTGLGVPVATQQANLNTLASIAEDNNIPIWFTTTQPRENLSPNEKQIQANMKDWIMTRFGARAIDFWTDIATPEYNINPTYSFNDGIHVNNAGHDLFYSRVVAEGILTTICGGSGGGAGTPANVAPTVNAGNNQTITLPTSSVTLSGTASDSDGTISSYAWTKVSGTGSTITTPSAANTTVTGLSQGSYTFRLTVTDNAGATATDDVVVTVNGDPNSLQTLTTINGKNAYVHLPGDYDSTGTKKYPLILYMPDLGSASTNVATDLLVYGPSRFVSQGNPMEFMVNGVLEKPIVVSVQSGAWARPTFIDAVLTQLQNQYRIDTKRIYLTGASGGGWSADMYVSDNTTRAAKIAAVMVSHAVTLDNPVSQMAYFANAGGKWWGIKGSEDTWGSPTIPPVMNAAVPGSARLTIIPKGQSGDTHCCFNTFYDPAWFDPATGESVYTWMLKQSKP